MLTHKTIRKDQLKRMDVTVVVADLKLTFQNFPSKNTTEILNINNGFQPHNIFFLNLFKDVVSTLEINFTYGRTD